LIHHLRRPNTIDMRTPNLIKKIKIKIKILVFPIKIPTGPKKPPPS